MKLLRLIPILFLMTTAIYGQEVVNVGDGTGTGETIRSAFIKVNTNFAAYMDSLNNKYTKAQANTLIDSKASAASPSITGTFTLGTYDTPSSWYWNSERIFVTPGNINMLTGILAPVQQQLDAKVGLFNPTFLGDANFSGGITVGGGGRIDSIHNDGEGYILYQGGEAIPPYIPPENRINITDVVIPELSGALTDGTPTAAEINAVTGLTPATAGAGYRKTIRDNNGTALLYIIESDGTSWFYIVMTKAL